MPLIDALDELRSFMDSRLVTAQAVLDQHAQSETWITARAPDAVAFPHSTDEVARIAAVCARHQMPLIPYGAGTSLEGHALAVKGGITLNFREMARVLSVRPEDRVVVVQPGLTREALNTYLRDTGLMFPVDPGANASIGGMASTRASGTTAVRYGTMRANVLALEVVLAGGRVIRTGTAAPKSSAGYDLTGLFVGAEGTLGILTEITLRLHPQPEAISAATCGFSTVADAVNCVIATMQSGVSPARIELLDSETVLACNAFSDMNLIPEPQLLVEFHGSPAFVAEEAQRFGEVAAGFGTRDFRWTRAAEERSRLWRMRHQAYPAILAARPGASAMVTDACVPISSLAQAIEETRADIQASGLYGPILGHVGDGNFHAILMIDPNSADDLDMAKAVAYRISERALRLGGTITGEHGVGMGKLDLMEAEHGPAWSIMAHIKRALDPHDMMNPGKMVPQK
jgi:D-lactate dehydrogenase (cytochrome)